jgi:uncharacterized RDD family membrane protein YckC
MEYASFWRRAGAWLTDGFLLTIASVTLSLPELLTHEPPLPFAFATSLLITALFVWFSVWLTFRYGGTPGKRIFGIHVAMRDGSGITLAACGRRYSVDMAIMAIGVALGVLAIAQGSEPEPIADAALSYVAFAWALSELVVMLMNRERRAIHDFIAGTVVLRGAPVHGIRA